MGAVKNKVGEKWSRRRLREGLCCTPTPLAAERSCGPRPRCQPSSRSKAADHRQKLQPKSAEQPSLVSATFPGAEPVPLAHLEMFVLRGSSRRLCPGRGLARSSRGGRQRPRCPPAVDAERRRRGLPQIGYFAPKKWVPVPRVEVQRSQHKLCLPRAGCGPRNPPNQQNPANLLQTRAARRCRTPGTSQRCLCLPRGSLWLSPRASLLFLRRVLFHCCLPSSQGSKFQSRVL